MMKLSFKTLFKCFLFHDPKTYHQGTDISKITRKQSKTGKHGHGNQKSTREAKDSKPKPEKVKPQSKKVKPWVKNVISRALIGSLKLEGHVAMKKAQGESISEFALLIQIDSRRGLPSHIKAASFEGVVSGTSVDPPFARAKVGDSSAHWAHISSTTGQTERKNSSNSKDALSKPPGLIFHKRSLCQRVIRFGKWGKLKPRYIGPFKIIAKVGTVVYRLELPEKLSRVHSTFHVSNMKKFLADEPLAIPLDEIKVNYKLHFIEEPIKIMDRKVKHLKQSHIPIVKVRCNSSRGCTSSRPNAKEIPAPFHQLYTRGRGCALSFEYKALLMGKECHNPSISV
ncbi:hypothetical protein Tco_1099768 [Tanacetum coccineum]